MLRLIAGYQKTFSGITVLEFALMLILAILAAVSILGHLAPPDECKVATRRTAALFESGQVQPSCIALRGSMADLEPT
jgi:hypothetical protein